MKSSRMSITLGCAALIAFTVTGYSLVQAQDARERGQGRGQMPDLVGGLKTIEGCLGVSTAQFSDGKSAILAWFENKQAVARWYNSPMHQGVMRMAGSEPATPLRYVADDEGPIMVMASITMSDKPQFDDFNMPISQIAIELYKPLPGGAYLGERVAPAALKVPHMKGHEQPVPAGR